MTFDPNKQPVDTAAALYYPTVKPPASYGGANNPDGNCIDQATVDALGPLPQYFVPIVTPQTVTALQSFGTLLVPVGSTPAAPTGPIYGPIATPDAQNLAADYGAHTAPPGFDSNQRPLSWSYLANSYTAGNGIGAMTSFFNPPQNGDTWDDGSGDWSIRWLDGPEWVLVHRNLSYFSKSCGITPVGQYGLANVDPADPGPFPPTIDVT